MGLEPRHLGPSPTILTGTPFSPAGPGGPWGPGLPGGPMGPPCPGPPLSPGDPWSGGEGESLGSPGSLGVKGVMEGCTHCRSRGSGWPLIALEPSSALLSRGRSRCHEPATLMRGKGPGESFGVWGHLPGCRAAPVHQGSRAAQLGRLCLGSQWGRDLPAMWDREN